MFAPVDLRRVGVLWFCDLFTVSRVCLRLKSETKRSEMILGILPEDRNTPIGPIRLID